MKRSSAAIALSILLLLGAPAAATSVEEATLSLGWLAEHAPLVVRVEVTRVLDRQAEARVLERLAGPGESPATVRVRFGEDDAPEVAPGAEALLFLRPPPAGGGRLFRLAGPTGTVRLEGESGAAIVRWVKAHLTLMAEDADASADPADLRAHVVGGVASGVDRLVHSAALDLVRLSDRLGPLDEEEASAVTAAFAACPFDDARKQALARAAGVAGGDAAVSALADAILTGRARPIRAAVGEALSRIGSAKAVELLLPGLAREEAPVRADTANALGRLGLEEGVEALALALKDPAGEVRIEAALALGNVARSVRKAKRRSIDALDALRRAYGAAKEPWERKAILWAAAQLDTQDGYDLLRKVAAEEENREIRRFAERTLANPRRKLVVPR